MKGGNDRLDKRSLQKNIAVLLRKRNAKISTRWLKFLNLKELSTLYVILVELIEAEDDFKKNKIYTF